jgi:uncharacterized protein YecE (DUF72 family)
MAGERSCNGSEVPSEAEDATAGWIRIGVAGWDYPDWSGRVYPAEGSRRSDRLEWISRFVDVVEINSTFYRPAAPPVAETWVRRTAGKTGFAFTAKSHRGLTHGPEDGADESLRATLEGLRPLAEAGRLGALLIQFPQSFHHGPAARDRISRLAEKLADWPAVVEVRHVSWEPERAAQLFRDHGIGWCAVDQPRIAGSTARAVPRVSGRVGYLRLHGRNAANWFKPGAGRDARYDYLYSEEEIASLASTAREMGQSAEEMYVIQNNHFRGQALVNALQLKHLVQGERPPAPEELVAAYPELEPLVTVQRTRLF